MLKHWSKKSKVIGLVGVLALMIVAGGLAYLVQSGKISGFAMYRIPEKGYLSGKVHIDPKCPRDVKNYTMSLNGTTTRASYPDTLTFPSPLPSPGVELIGDFGYSDVPINVGYKLAMQKQCGYQGSEGKCGLVDETYTSEDQQQYSLYVNFDFAGEKIYKELTMVPKEGAVAISTYGTWAASQGGFKTGCTKESGGTIIKCPLKNVIIDLTDDNGRIHQSYSGVNNSWESSTTTSYYRELPVGNIKVSGNILNCAPGGRLTPDSTINGCGMDSKELILECSSSVAH